MHLELQHQIFFSWLPTKSLYLDTPTPEQKEDTTSDSDTDSDTEPEPEPESEPEPEPNLDLLYQVVDGDTNEETERGVDQLLAYLARQPKKGVAVFPARSASKPNPKRPRLKARRPQSPASLEYQPIPLPDDSVFVCPVCLRQFPTLIGTKRHVTWKHKKRARKATSRGSRFKSHSRTTETQEVCLSRPTSACAPRPSSVLK